MPREIVHWAVLDQGTSQLQASGAPQVHECLVRYKSAAYLGAILHDAPYYYRFGGKSFEAVAEWLHGRHGEDTFVPMRELANEIQSATCSLEERIAHWAMLFGMISHMVTDTVFHPMVFYFSGDYYDPRPEQREDARARHRLLEVYLDSWFRAHKGPFLHEGDISAVCRALVQETPQLYRILDASLGAKTVSRRFSRPVQGEWHDAVWYQAFIQKLCRAQFPGAVTSILNRASKGSLRAIEAISSYGRNYPHPVFDNALDYRNPVSGEHRITTVTELLADAAAEFQSICQRFEPLLAGSSTAVDEVLEGIQGKSLNFGILRARPEDASHYAHRGLPIPGLTF